LAICSKVGDENSLHQLIYRNLHICTTDRDGMVIVSDLPSCRGKEEQIIIYRIFNTHIIKKVNQWLWLLGYEIRENFSHGLLLGAIGTLIDEILGNIA
jgi:altronate dehydratase